MWPSSFDRCSSRGTENLTGTIGSMQETTLEVEHISTIAGSLGSLGSHSGNDQVYDTDHTDLNSDFDESELKRDLLKDVSNINQTMEILNIHPFILNRNGGSYLTWWEFEDILFQKLTFLYFSLILKDSVKSRWTSFCQLSSLKSSYFKCLSINVKCCTKERWKPGSPREVATSHSKTSSMW